MRKRLLAIALLAYSRAPEATADGHVGDVPATQTVVARAIDVSPSAAVISYVARNAVPTTLDTSLRPDLKDATIRQVAELQCGSVQNTYLDELALANAGRSLDPDRRLGDIGTPIALPACLYAKSEPAGAESYTVRSGDTLTGIHQRFTGSGMSQLKGFSRFLSESGVEIADARTLQPGRLLRIPTTTAATVLNPLAGAVEFAAQLSAVSKGSVVAEMPSQAVGEIIGPVRFNSPVPVPGAIQSSFSACERGDGSLRFPIDGGAIASAYNAARSRITSPVSPVSIVVVDNGFFGVTCTSTQCPQLLPPDSELAFSERFPRSLFDMEAFRSWGGLGPSLLGTQVDPLNYYNLAATGSRFLASDVNDESGHGTHVAGLTLGGPGFLPYRGVYSTQSGKSWLTMVIANLAAGSTELSAASARNLSALLATVEGYRILNMSVAFNGQADESIAETLSRTLADDPKSLVVAAAGNSGADLQSDSQDFYPARLGGAQSANVLTVASVDGPVAGVIRLSNFSNRGASFVDLAAPGCGVDSWLNAERDAVAISGTSQAAPLVTFAASLLQSLWKTSPGKLKNRLMYSGELLTSPADRMVVRSMARLDVVKALLFPWDRITFRRSGVSRTLLGELQPIQSMACDVLGPVPAGNIRSIKRSEDGLIAIYRADSNSRLDVCWGAASTDELLVLQSKMEVGGDGEVVVAESVERIRISEVTEVIRAR